MSRRSDDVRASLGDARLEFLAALYGVADGEVPEEAVEVLRGRVVRLLAEADMFALLDVCLLASRGAVREGG